MKFHSLIIRLFFLSLCLTFLVQGSCSQPLYWTKPNAEVNEFDRDLANCHHRLNQQGERAKPFGLSNISPSFGTDSVAVEQCLAEKGWFLVRKTSEE